MEALFYHLERQALEEVLPGLLEKSLERGWHAVVQAETIERIQALDNHLWTYLDESFLPHSAEANDLQMQQPIWLTVDAGNPNDAEIRFFVDRATPAEHDDITPYERLVFLFDGSDEVATENARKQWKYMKEKGLQLTYWHQNDRGRWAKKDL